MADLDEMSLEKFKLWSVNALRVYLSMRNKAVTGNFDELAARAFCAWEDKITVDETAEQQQLRLLKEYQDKLTIDGCTYPDPFKVNKEHWLGEKQGIEKWPSVYIMDISAFLNAKNTDTLMKRLMNEYKEGKAYRYFSGEWVKEIFIYSVSAESKMCFVKSKVTPSQAIRNKAYDVWIALVKDSKDTTGGQILSSHCTCVAGMLGSCNHIAGVLFRIEYAVKTGRTKPSCTEKPCQWTVPKRTNITPGKVSDFVWKKTHYMKLPIDSDKENEKILQKSLFTPLKKSQKAKTDNLENMRLTIHNLMKGDMQNSCFSLTMDKRRFKSPEQIPEMSPPPSIIQVAKLIEQSEDNVSESDKKDKLMVDIQLTDTQCQNLSLATVDQGDSDEWKEQRLGRITASNFHRVCKRSITLRNNPSEDPTSVLNLVIGGQSAPQTKAMKHGSSLEPVAKRMYIKHMKTGHKNFESKDVGLLVIKDKPYLGCSPDILVSCSCCGDGLCEIKCPESVKDLPPTPENIPYLYQKDGIVELKKNHPYYFQIQGQLGITGRGYCDLFIFTYHGNLTIRIEKNEVFFKTMIDDCEWFWKQYVVGKLLFDRPVLAPLVCN